MWPAGLAAWGGGGRSGVWGRGPPEETGSGQRWCPLTTAEARSVQGAETEAGVRAPWGGGGRRYRRARARVRGKAGGPSAGAARGLEPGFGVPLLGRGTSGATFPACSRRGRLCPPEPDRRGTTLAASFLRWWEVREPPGNREGKVLNWGSSGSERGGWGERAEDRDSFLGVRSEVAGEVLRRGGVSEGAAFCGRKRSRLSRERASLGEETRDPAVGPAPRSLSPEDSHWWSVM